MKLDISYLSAIQNLALILILGLKLVASAPYEKKITTLNCINGVVIQTSCVFSIEIVPTISSPLLCTLKFGVNETEVLFTSSMISIVAQTDNKCPFFAINFTSSVKNSKISSTCGGEIAATSKTLSGFIQADFSFDNSGLTDTKTNILAKIQRTNLDKLVCEKGKAHQLKLNGQLAILIGFIISREML